MLTLGQAFIAKPKLLMIDELSLGLAPVVVEELLEIVRRIHDEGTSVILVEQSVNVALTVADRALFMEKGEVRFSGPTAELLHRDDILRAVFLTGAREPAGGPGQTQRRPCEGRWRCLEVIGLTVHFGGVDGGRRRQLRPAAGRDPRHHRPQRGGQDDGVRRHLRLRPPRVDVHPRRSRHHADVAREAVARAGSAGRSRTPGCSRRSRSPRRSPSRSSATSGCKVSSRRRSPQPWVRRAEKRIKAGRRADRADGPRRLPRQVRVRAVHRLAPHRRPRRDPGPRAPGAPARRAVVGHRPARDRGARARCCCASASRPAPACSSSSTTCRSSRRSPTRSWRWRPARC